MKKIISMVLCICINLSFLSVASADYSPNPLEIEESKFDDLMHTEITSSVSALSNWNIVKNPYEKWSENDLITRRNAYEMVLLVREKSLMPRALEKAELLNEAFPYSYLIEKTKITDVQYDTYDCSLLCYLDYHNLISGKINQKGDKVAAFDDYLTYHEALAIILRMMQEYYAFYYNVEKKMKTWDTNYPYFKLAEEIGLVNGNNLVSYGTLTINESQMKDYIPAYKFMYLLHQAMYIPVLAQDDYSGAICSFRYIDYFIERGAIEDFSYDEERYYPIP